MTTVPLPLRVKVFAGCGGLAFLVWLVGSAVLYHGASISLRQEVRQHIKAVAAIAALQVDPCLHETILTPSDESTPQYQRLKHILQRVRDDNPSIRHIYTMRTTAKPGIWQFVVDAEENPDEVSHVGEEYDVHVRPEMQKAIHGPSVDSSPTTDRRGTWLSAYAPVRDSAGRSVAILGLDMSMAGLRHEEAALRRAALLNMLAAFVASVLLSLLATKAILRPVELFTRAAERIRNGDLDFQLDLPKTDEIGEFAEAFDLMITALRESREQIMDQTTCDSLTGLYNHMYFHEQLETEIERSKRYSHPISLLILDIDRFKNINDTFGHPLGDSIIHQVGVALRRLLRSMDIPARYGSDEFAIMLPETGEEDALAAAERLRAAIEAHAFYAVPIGGELEPGQAGKRVPITVTIGVATCPKHHQQRDGLIMAADIALCRAKHLCRNSVCSYTACSGGNQSVDPQELYEMLRNPNVAAAQSLAAAVDARDRYTSGHSERVTAYALKLSDALGLDQAQQDLIKIGGLLHDLGKIGVPDAVLNKPGGLTKEEFEVIRQHPCVGENILRRTPQLELVLPAVLYHHERWDGTGYPQGLVGEEIPFMARLMAVADSFDAMTTDRPYRKAMAIEDALLELRANAGKQFDPALVNAFITAVSSPDQKAA